MSKDKLQFLGWIKAAQLAGNPIDYLEASAELQRPVSTLKSWKLSFDKATLDQGLSSVIDLDEVMLETLLANAAAEIEADIAKVPDIVIGENGEISIVGSEENKEISPLDRQVLEQFKGGVIGLQKLSEDLQTTAGALTLAIAQKANNAYELEAKELNNLASALTNIQNAFFNKPVTNVNVTQVNDNRSALLSRFTANLKP